MRHPITDISTAIRKAVGALTIKKVVPELTDVLVPGCIGKCALASLFVCLECPNILVAIEPSFLTLPNLHVIYETSNIYAAIGVGITALTVQLVVFELTDVFMTDQNRTIPPGFGALSSLYRIREISLIGAAIRKRQGALTVLLAIPEASNVFISS